MHWNADDWTALGTYFTGLTVLAAIVTIVIGLRESRAANLRTKRQATVDFYTQTMAQRIDWGSGLPSPRNAKEVEHTLNELGNLRSAGLESAVQAQELEGTINAYLNFWELLAISVENDVFDEALLMSLLGSHAIAVANHYKPYIDSARARTEDFGHAQRWLAFEKMADSWRRQGPQMSSESQTQAGERGSNSTGC